MLHVSLCRLRAISYCFFEISGCNASRAVYPEIKRFFFSDYRDKGRGHDRRLRASCCETRDTRVLAGETLVAVARDVYDPTNVKKNKIVLAI